MPYAQGRTFYDADSHVMELPDFLTRHVDPECKVEVPRISFGGGGRMSDALEQLAGRDSHPPERQAELLALGDELIAGPKGYWALGAFSRDERAMALDRLGFHRQLVFSTFSASLAFRESRSLEVRYATSRAHNRAVADFCAKDSRLMGVAALPLDDTALALRELEHVLELGLAAVWVPHRPCGGRSPGHDDLDPIWAKLAHAGVPFVLHVGGDPLQVDPAWMNTGRPIPTDWLGGGENVRAKDMTSLHQKAETFISALVLDGVFERHPGLRGGAIELGAGWVPAMLKRLDWIAQIWQKSEPEIRALSNKPSEQIIQHMAFTPYPYEDVGDLIRQSDDRLYLFSSDYPHIEGGRNPLGRFEATLGDCDARTRERFYSENFVKIFRNVARVGRG